MRQRLLFVLLLLLVPAALLAQVTTLVHISDLHLGKSLSYEPPSKEGWRAAVQAILRDCNEVLKPAAVIATGDLVSSPGTENFADYVKTMSALQAPLLNCPGNHDLGYGQGPGSYVEALGPLHQTRMIEGVLVVCMDTGSLLGKADPTAELAWLSAALATPEAQGARVRIVCGHYPVYEDEARVNGGLFAREDFQILGASREAFLHALRLGKATLYLNGHVHGNWDEVCLTSGTRHLMTSSAAEGLYRVVVMDGENIGARAVGNGAWPLVIVTSPAPYVTGSSVRNRGLVKVRAKVFANAELEQVSYTLDGAAAVPLQAAAEGMREADLDLTGLKPGLHKLVVTATCASGRKGEAEQRVLVAK